MIVLHVLLFALLTSDFGVAWEICRLRRIEAGLSEVVYWIGDAP